MVKVKSKALEPAESAELVQANTGGLNKVIIDRYLSLQQRLGGANLNQNKCPNKRVWLRTSI